MNLQSSILSRSFLVFLLIGLSLRLWNLQSPLVDAMSPRQAQTADAIRSLIEEPGLQLDSNTSWRGSSAPRLVQEFPIYSLISQGVYETMDQFFYEARPPKPNGADPHLIDLSARMVSVVFWALTFLLLQSIWSRFLTQRETFWANGIFVFAPLSIFFGQAAMPEMVFLFFATGFVVAALRYSTKPTLKQLSVVFLCSVFASLIKMPGFSHLVLLAVAILWRERGFRFLLRPAHWGAGILILAAIKSWSGYVTAVNVTGFPEWTSESSLRLFFGDPMERLKPALYIKVGGYITAFLLSPLGVGIAAIGLWQAFRIRASEKGFLALAWTVSIVLYILVWGTQTAGAHSYYNLPMLIPAAMLFGIGMSTTLKWTDRWKVGKWKKKNLLSPQTSEQFKPKHRTLNFESLATASRPSTPQMISAATISVFILLPMGVMTSYLFREDRALLAAAEWIQKNIPEGGVAGVKFNHSPYYIDYFHVPAVSYYSGRNCFVIGRTMSDEVLFKGLKECDVIVETLPEKRDGMKAFSVFLKGAERPVDKLERATESGFVPGSTTEGGLRIWKKPQLADPLFH